MRESITIIEKVFNTRGSHPVRVRCDDRAHYVVKYKKHPVANNLFNEYIGASFLKLWSLATPDFELVHIKKEHIPVGLHPSISPDYFESTCFGSKFSRDYSDISDILNGSSKSWEKQFIYKNELLFIALFDIWLANEDRNINNANLMYDISRGNRFIPIDHQYIFNSSNLEYGLSQLTEYDSILGNEIFMKLFRKSEIINNQNLLDEMKNKYYFYVGECKKNLNRIIMEIPEDWNINVNYYVELLENHLFKDKWIEDCWKNFEEILLSRLM